MAHNGFADWAYGYFGKWEIHEFEARNHTVFRESMVPQLHIGVFINVGNPPNIPKRSLVG